MNRKHEEATINKSVDSMDLPAKSNEALFSKLRDVSPVASICASSLIT